MGGTVARQMGQNYVFTRLLSREKGSQANSEIKRGYGIGRARYRGLTKTDIQMQFTAAACNIRRWSARLCWLAHQATGKAS